MKPAAKDKIIKIFFTLAVIVEGVSLFCNFSLAQAVPEKNIQGKIDFAAVLLNNQNKAIANGDYDIRFAIYRSDRTTPDPYPSTTDPRVWEETQKVHVSSGILHAYLGASKVLPTNLNFSSGEYYVGVRIGTDSEMVPRKRIGGVPLALDALTISGASVGTAPKNVLQLGENGKVDIANLPTGKTGSTLVLSNDSRLVQTKIKISGASYISVSNHKLTLNSIDLTSDVDGALPIENGGTGIETYAAGDMVYSSAADTLSKLAIGADGKVLTVSGGLPTWADAATGTTYTAKAGNLLQLTGTEFSVKHGTMTDTKLCSYDATLGLVCDTDAGVGGVTYAAGSGLTQYVSGSTYFKLGGTITEDTDLNLYGSSSSRNLRFYNSNSAAEILFLDGVNSRIGIGTTNPLSALDVKGRIRSTGSGSTVYGGIYSSDAAGGLYFGTETNHPVIFNVNNTEVARLSTGSTPAISIGTSDVHGTLYLYDSSASGSTALVLRAGSNQQTSKSNLYQNFDNANNLIGGWTKDGYLFWRSDNQTYFKILDQSSGVGTETARLVIDNNGNVGIGTTSPTTALDVNGVITATGGNSTNWNSAYSGMHNAVTLVTTAHDYLSLSTQQITLGAIDISDDTNLGVGGTMLQLSGDTVSLKEGALTDGRLCTYVSGTGLVCDTSSSSVGHTPVTINATANGLSVDGSQVLSLATASGSTTGALSFSDWTTFNSKQAAGNYITALTGEVTASGPGSVSATVSNAAVIGKVLTGFVSGAGTITATDTILSAIEKLNGNISGGVTGSGAAGYLSYWDSSSSIASSYIYQTGGKVGIGTTAPGQLLSISGTLGISASNPQYFSIFQGASQSGNITYTLPGNDGDSDQVLVSDGSGVLSWKTVTGISGAGTVTSVASGNGLTGGPITGSGTLSINLLGVGVTTPTTSSYSGMEVSSSGLSLLHGCSNAQVLSWDSNAQTWKCDSISGIGGLSGSGSAGYITYWDSGSTLANSYIYQIGGNVGIGTTSPTAGKLQVSGTIYGSAFSDDGVAISGDTAQAYLSSALSTGLVKVTTSTGALSVVTDNSTNWDSGYTYRITGVTDSITGLDFSLASNNITLALTTGYVIPTTTQESNWNSAYSGMHNAVTLVTTAHDYLSLSTQQITLGAIDISDDTNLGVGGTMLQLSGDTVSLKEGALTDGRLCTYVSGTGLVCDTTAGSVGVNYWQRNGTIVSPSTIGDYVGIGTTSSSALLTLAGSSTARASLNIAAGTAPSSPVSGDIWYDGSNLYFRNGASSINVTGGLLSSGTLAGQTIYYNGTSWAASNHLFNNGTSVGIGTTNPSGVVQIIGDEVRIGDAGTIDTATGDGDLYVEDALEVDGTSTFYNLKFSGYLQMSGTAPILSNADLRIDIDNNGGATDNYFSLSHDGGTELFRIQENGKVGIGTTNPGSKLSVSGGLSVGTTASSSSYLTTLAPDGGAIFEGNVGIGTTNPTKKLDVAGSVQIASSLSGAGAGVSAGLLYLNATSIGTGATAVVWTSRSWTLPSGDPYGSYDIGDALGDIDGDGDLDLVTTYHYIGTEHTYAFRNTGTRLSPEWSTAPIWTWSSGVTYPALYDMDRDGKADLIRSPGDAKFYGYKSTGTGFDMSTISWYFNATSFSGSYYPTWPAAADFDNDGLPDMMLGSTGGVIHGVKGTTIAVGGTSPWVQETDWDITISGWYNTMVTAADLNNDGRMDLIAMNDSGTIRVYQNVGGTALFSRNTAWETGLTDPGTPGGIAAGDVTGDGAADVLMSDTVTASFTRKYENTGTAGERGTTLFGLAVAGVEKIRMTGGGDIYAQGRVGIGTSSPDTLYSLDVKSAVGTVARFTGPSNVGCAISDGALACSSDKNLKKNITDSGYGLDTIMSLRTVEYNWNSESDSTEKSVGFIAQEVETILPKLVTTDSTSGYKQLNTIGMVPILTKAVQELTSLSNARQAEITDQIAEINKNNLTLTKEVNAQGDQIAAIGMGMNNIYGRINLLAQKITGENWETKTFFSFGSPSSEVSTDLRNTSYKDEYFSGEYTNPTELQKIAIDRNTGLDLTDFDSSKGYLVFDIYIEDADIIKDFTTELGSERDKKEIKWKKKKHPYFLDGWNEVRLFIEDGEKIGEVDWTKLDYFQVTFQYMAKNKIAIRNVRVEVMPKSTNQNILTFSGTDFNLDNPDDQKAAILAISQKVEEGTGGVEMASSGNSGSIEEQMELMEEKYQSVFDFAQMIDSKSLVYKDKAGNLDVTGGSVEANGIVAGVFSVKTTDKENKTVGDAEILPVKTDKDLDGIDDETMSNGKMVLVETKAVSDNSRIFITPQDDPGSYLWTEKKRDSDGNFVGFVIHSANEVKDKVKIDWWIIEEAEN